MSYPHIQVIDPGSRVAEIDAFNRLGESPYCRFSYHLPCMYGMESLNDLQSSPDAIIVFGSGASVYDDLPWIKELSTYLARQVDNRVPLLGLCFGHQLIAAMYGGKVDFISEDRHKLKGLRQISLDQNNDFWEGQTRGQFIVSHREEVTELGDELEVFARSNECRYDGIRHKDKPVWGMQSHPEAGPGFARNQDIEVDKEKAPFESGALFMASFCKMIAEKSS